MGVYNPLVDMPESCAECFTRGGWSNCVFPKHMSYPNALHSRHPDCPLIEVKTPHGRMIDADAILNAKGNKIQVMTGSDFYYHESVIQYAPTVIEAEN